VKLLTGFPPLSVPSNKPPITLRMRNRPARTMPFIVLFCRPQSEGSLTATGHGLPGPPGEIH
jgi:hypothetical protein